MLRQAHIYMKGGEPHVIGKLNAIALAVRLGGGGQIFQPINSRTGIRSKLHAFTIHGISVPRQSRLSIEIGVGV
jgi:hypothetical protein